MRRTDDVFFFVLIDFLLQVFFFGLLLYVLGQSNLSEVKAAQEKRNNQVETLLSITGFSNLTQLTDYLTNLTPVKEWKGIADFFNGAGGVGKVIETVKIVTNAGGSEQVIKDLAKLHKYEEGAGKPPCVFDIINGRKVAKPLATVVAQDSSICFESSTPELEEMLQQLGRSYESIRELSLSSFRSTFQPLINKRPDCRYTLRFIERTRYVDARDAAQSVFYLKIVRR